MDDIDRRGKEHRVAALAGGVAQGDAQMSLSESLSGFLCAEA
jgi:hypothetical protein